MLFRLNLALILLVMLAMALLPSSASRSVIVIPRPFGPDAAAIVAQAQGVLLRSGAAGSMLARGAGLHFVARLYAHGALMVLDGKFLQGCAS